MGVNHLLQAAGLGNDQVVRQNDRRRPAADQPPRTPDRMSKAKCLVLADIGNAAAIHVGGGKRVQQLCLAGHAQGRLKRGIGIEVIFKRRLSARGDKDEIGNPRLARLFDRVLDQRFVHQRQDLFRDRLGGGQKPRPETRNRKDRGCNFGAHEKNPLLRRTLRRLTPGVRRAAA